jgi:hypothetical protein
VADAGPKVVALHGGPVEQPGVPDPDVIEQLERALEMARSGEMTGLVMVSNHFDGCTSSSRRGICTRRTVGEIELAKASLVQRLLDEP